MFFPLASINNNALIMVYQNLNDDQNRDVANANKIGEIKHKLTLQRGLMRTAESTRGSQIAGKREAHPFSAPSPFSLLRSEQFKQDPKSNSMTERNKAVPLAFPANHKSIPFLPLKHTHRPTEINEIQTVYTCLHFSSFPEWSICSPSKLNAPSELQSFPSETRARTS